MIKADLHVHSTVSDGSFTVDEILSVAKDKGLTHIAFTEHDTTEGYEYAVCKAKEFNITAIPAIEISAMDYNTGKKAHILGYGYKSTYQLERYCKHILELRHNNSLKQIKILQELGYQITSEDLDRGNRCIYKQHIMAHLVKTGQATDMFGEFYQSTFKNGGACDFDITYMPVKVAVEIITEDGGTAVLAHPLQQDNLYLIENLIPYGLRGLECNHPSTPENRKSEILDLCMQHKLIVTGGSDFHGKYSTTGICVGDIYTDVWEKVQ